MARHHGLRAASDPVHCRGCPAYLGIAASELGEGDDPLSRWLDIWKMGAAWPSLHPSTGARPARRTWSIAGRIASANSAWAVRPALAADA